MPFICRFTKSLHVMQTNPNPSVSDTGFAMLSVIGKRIRSLLLFIGRRIKDPLLPMLGGEWISMFINNQGKVSGREIAW